MIATRLDEAIASPLQQPVAVLFLGNELIDISDSVQHGIEVFASLLRSLTPCHIHKKDDDYHGLKD